MFNVFSLAIIFCVQCIQNTELCMHSIKLLSKYQHINIITDTWIVKLFVHTIPSRQNIIIGTFIFDSFLKIEIPSTRCRRINENYMRIDNLHTLFGSILGLFCWSVHNDNEHVFIFTQWIYTIKIWL